MPPFASIRFTIFPRYIHPSSLYSYEKPLPPPCTASSLLLCAWQRGEQRPRFSGRHSACHDHHPELSGAIAPPDYSDPSSPAISLALYPIGGDRLHLLPWSVRAKRYHMRVLWRHHLAGFCGVSKNLPLPHVVDTEASTAAVKGTGMNATFEETVHCIAAEPHATFLRVAVADCGQEVAYASAVLGRLRRGFRVFQMRSMLGTRIELAYLCVQISFGSEPHMWATPRQVWMCCALVHFEMVTLPIFSRVRGSVTNAPVVMMHRCACTWMGS